MHTNQLVLAPFLQAQILLEYTFMTYRSYVNGPTNGYTNELGGYPQTFMMLDIAALQHMYGANFTTNAGNTTYSWNTATGVTNVNDLAATDPVTNRIFITIWMVVESIHTIYQIIRQASPSI